jgi:hypothetical protein
VFLSVEIAILLFVLAGSVALFFFSWWVSALIGVAVACLSPVIVSLLLGQSS